MLDIYILRILKIAIVMLGSLLVYLSMKSYLRHNRKEMLTVAFGFTFITIGSVLAGILFEFLGNTLLDVNIVEGAMVVIGFALLTYSIYGFE